MLVSWFPANGDPEIIFQDPTYTGDQPDLLGKIPVTHVTTSSPDQDGEDLLASPLATRDGITLSYVLHADSASALALAIRTLSRAFSPKAGPGTLKVVADDAMTFFIDCIIAPKYPVYSISNNDRSSTGAGLSDYWQRFTISLVAHKPWWYTSATPETYNPWVGMDFPIDFDPVTGMDFGVYAGTKELENLGDLATPFTCQVDGPMVNPILTNTTTGEAITITKTLILGQRLYIETTWGNIKCEIRDSSDDSLIEDAFKYASVDSVWFWIEPGINNVEFHSSDANDGSSMIISWEDRYSTV
jgi:hypothetical protein